MPFEFTAKPRPEGKYVSMTDMVKLGEALNVAEVIDDDDNMYKGEKKPRFLLKGTIGDSEQDVLVTVSKGYSRDDIIVAIAEYLDSNEDEPQVRFVRTAGSSYIDIVTA